MRARIGWFALTVLIALQWVWHGWLAPPRRVPIALALFIAVTPLLLPLLGALCRRPNALFYAATLSLFYFCHGVMEAWSEPGVRVLALIEVLLAVAVVLSVGGDGLRRRRETGVIDTDVE